MVRHFFWRLYIFKLCQMECKCYFLVLKKPKSLPGKNTLFIQMWNFLSCYRTAWIYFTADIGVNWAMEQMAATSFHVTGVCWIIERFLNSSAAMSRTTSRHNTETLNRFSYYAAAMRLCYVLSAHDVLAGSLFNTQFLVMIQCKTVIQVITDNL